MPVYDDEELKAKEDQLDDGGETTSPEEDEQSRLGNDSYDDENQNENEDPEKKPTKNKADDSTAAPEPEEDSSEGSVGDDEPSWFKNEGKGKSKGRLNRLRKKHKKKFIAATIAGGGLIAVVIAFFLFLSSLKLVQLAENITVYNMARSARTLRLGTAGVMEENIASQTASDNLLARLKTRFGETKLAKGIEKFNRLRPEKVFKNFNSRIEPVYTTTGTNILGQPKKTFQGYNYKGLDGTVSFIEKADQKWFKPFSNSTERVRFATDWAAVLDKDLQGYKPYVRGGVLSKIRADKGIRLKWWDKAGKDYNGVTRDKAARLAQQDAERAINDPAESSCKVVSVCDAEKETKKARQDALKEAVDDPDGGGAATVESKVDDATAKKLAVAVKESGVSKVISAFSTVYAVAVPLCLVYEGSLENSADDIDSNSDSLQRTYFAVSSAADQQKTGETTPEAIGGFNDKLGDTTNSIPELRASGQAIDTSTVLNQLELPQSSATGTFSLLNVALGDSDVVDAMNYIADYGCEWLTDLWVGGGVAVAEFIASLFTGGGTKVTAETSKQGVKLMLQNLGKRLAFEGTRKIAQEKGRAAALKLTAGKFLFKTGLMVGGTLGATELAKMAVIKHMGAANDGLATGTTFANQADMGGNLFAQDMNRSVLYGRPMTSPEVAQSKTDDLAYINDVNSRKSFGERYFALSNPSSLLSKVGLATQSLFSQKGNSLGKLFSTIGKALSMPMKFISSILGKNAFAAENTISGAGDYNIVQWGWSSEELGLIDNNPDEYSPMVNDLVLDQSGKAGDIENKFGKCFSNSIGTLLADEHIQRELDGKVKPDDGDCAPNKLGINNAEFGDGMVFRWRLSKMNDNILQQMLDIQEPSESDVVAGSGPAPLTTPGLNGYTIPCTGLPTTVIRKTFSSPSADWSGIRDSGTIGTGSDGRPIKVYVREACGADNVKTIVLVSSIHGSENGGQLVSHELLFNADLPNNVRIVAIPELNGYGIAQGIRKNGNQVDLNRNNDYGWSSLNETDETLISGGFYKGPHVGSEPETKAINTFLSSIGRTSLSVYYHDNLAYVAAVGNTSVTLAQTYANKAGLRFGKEDGSTRVTQRGSVDAWYNSTTKTPTLLVEMSSDQSAGIINNHVEAIKALAAGGGL